MEGDGAVNEATLLEEKRQRRRAKNRAKKDDARREREEEIRRRLCEPKNLRVRLVGADEADAMRGVSRPPVVNVALATPGDFPDLGSYRKGVIRARERTTRIEETPPTDVVDPKETELKTNVKPRRADPITIDLVTVLKAGDKKPPPPVSAPRKKAATSPPLHGNQLDSSNPERKRGKQRENPRPAKPSHLKAVILRDRMARQALRAEEQLAEKSTNETSQEVANENDTPGALNDVSDDVTKKDRENKLSPLETVTLQDGKATRQVDQLAENSPREDPPLKELTNKNKTAAEVKVTAEVKVAAEEDAKEKVVCEKRPSAIAHSRKYRDYCDHVPSPELDRAVTALVSDIVRFQDRAYHADPVRAHAKRRFVLGLRETRKYLTLRKLRLVVVAPDLEMVRSAGGIDDAVAAISLEARSQGVPVAFSVGRATLRRLTNKSKNVRGVSCIGVVNYEGSQDNFRTVVDLLPRLRERYALLTSPPPAEEAQPELSPPEETPEETTAPPDDVNKQVVATLLAKLTKELENE